MVTRRWLHTAWLAAIHGKRWLQGDASLTVKPSGTPPVHPLLLKPLELSLSDCGGGEGVEASALLALLLPLLPPAGGEREGEREKEREGHGRA